MLPRRSASLFILKNVGCSFQNGKNSTFGRVTRLTLMIEKEVAAYVCDFPVCEWLFQTRQSLTPSGNPMGARDCCVAGLLAPTKA
jgi:hypothetical protein